MDAVVAHRVETQSSSLTERAIPRHKPEIWVDQYNFYVVRRGFHCGLYFNWPDCERIVRGFSGAQFKGFQSRKEAERYLRA
jgi:hypothetical protein